MNNREYRYEYKFAMRGVPLEAIQQVVLNNDAMFSPLYYPRHINNVYFDTYAMDKYTATVNGHPQRNKIRLRWYGGGDEPAGFPAQLEVKIRKNVLNSKDIYVLSDDTLDYSDHQEIQNLLDNNEMPSAAQDLMMHVEPVLVNRYYRHYYLSADSRFRLTIDHNMQFGAIGEEALYETDRLHRNPNLVVELKFLPENSVAADQISKQFPFRLTRNSKYTTGIELLKDFGHL